MGTERATVIDETATELLALPGDDKSRKSSEAKIIADWSAPASDFTFYVFGSRIRGSHHSNRDVDLYCKLPSKPTHKSTSWWTKQNSENFNSLQQVLPGLLLLSNS
jgi:predicted nucleotidyltransferase